MIGSALRMKIGFIIFAIVTAIVSTIFFCFCLIELIKYRKEPFFQKRRPVLVLTTLIVYYFAIIADVVLESIFDAQITNSTSSRILLDWIRWPMFICSYMVLSMILIRMWLLYYDMQLSQSLKNQNWQMAINPDVVSSNWFLKLKNQSRYGKSGKYLIIAALIIATYQNMLWYFVGTVFDTDYIPQIQTYLLLIAQVTFVFEFYCVY